MALPYKQRNRIKGPPRHDVDLDLRNRGTGLHTGAWRGGFFNGLRDGRRPAKKSPKPGTVPLRGGIADNQH